MTTLNERYENGQAMRASMAGGNQSHFAVPGIDRLAPDLRRIIDEALFGRIWTRPGLTLEQHCMCTIAALMALRELPLLRRHIERCLNVGLTPAQVIEVFIQLTFYVGVPATEAAMRITEDVFEEQGVQFTPEEVYDTQKSVEELYEIGVQTHQAHLGNVVVYNTEDSTPEERELDQLIHEYYWGVINNRPHLDAKSRSLCSLAAMTVLGQYDRQIRRRIEGALRVGLTPSEIMEIFVHVMLYGGYLTARTAMLIARSVFTERGILPQQQK